MVGKGNPTDSSSAITAFAAALAQLPAQPSDDGHQKIMRVLLARDQVARLVSESHALTPEALQRLAELDERLTSAAIGISSMVGDATLVHWRESVQPPASAWWWHLDERAKAAAPEPHPVWTILAGLFLTLSAALFIDTSQKLLSAGADWIGVLATLLQGLLTLTAAGTLLDIGHEGLDRFLGNLGIDTKTHYYWKTALAFLVFLVMLLIRATLPSLANYYVAEYTTGQALNEYARGHLSKAISELTRATAINPENLTAHYNLAVAYEEAWQLDKAQPEYLTAIALDHEFYPAYNNLARLYLRAKNYSQALALLDNAIEFDPKDPAVLYSLYKNRGWANWGLAFYAQADQDLHTALTLREHGAAAHCLLAQVFESEGNAKLGLPEWEECLRYAKEDYVEAEWLGMAKQRLAQEGTK